MLLEPLSSEERAVLLLRDVFDYSNEEIASNVGKSRASVRQLASRARKHVEEGRPGFATSREQQEKLARRFFAAVTDGDPGAVLLDGDGLVVGIWAPEIGPGLLQACAR